MFKKIAIIAIFLFCNYSIGFADCPFCNQQVLERQLIAENENLAMLVDFAPVIEGHLLIIPKRHIQKAHEMSNVEWTSMDDMIKKAVFLFQKALGSDQYILLEKNGPSAGQTVPHVHFHVLPMPTNEIADSLKHTLYLKIFSHFPEKLSREALKVQVERYRELIKTYDRN
jgi:histidine triad (HIT) family protein